MATVADVLVQGLKEAGIEVVFGLPGGENIEILDAIYRHGMRFVLVHNESSAVYMADVTARLTGKVGVCLTTLGPGAANAVAGVAHAFMDRAPVLIITAKIPDRLRRHRTHQAFDQTALFTPITKQSITLSPVNVGESIGAALSLTQRGRPGPVHLQVSGENAAQTTMQDTTGPDGQPKMASRPESMTRACRLLSEAKKPVIVVGLGLEPERPYDALCELAEAARAPVIATPKGKGSVPDDHFLSAGTMGLTRNDPAYQLLHEADCIIAVGFDV
ncbi:MAG: thiamine pyrophosphate-binding protein, partial [Planctomycetota bacterium]